jgi:hypothetical protein
MKGLPASTGIVWLKQGFALFRQQPGVLMMLIITNLLVAMLLSPLPVLGPILSCVAIPSFTIAIQQACRLIDEGQRVHLNVILTGFSKESATPLFKLGLVYLALFGMFSLGKLLFVDPVALKAVMSAVEAKAKVVPDSGTVLVFSGLILVLGLAALTLSFAPGLTYWKRMPTFKAVFYSVFAVLGAKAAIAVMLFTWIGALALLQIVIGAIFGANAIGQVVLTWFSFIGILIFHCATYVAYKQILGAPGDEPGLAK